MSQVWSGADLCTLAMRGVRARAQALDDEHAWRGIDAMEEVEWHALLFEALASDGLAARREVLYPGEQNLARLPRDRQRCDLVVAPDADRPIADLEEGVRQADRAARGGLFAQVARQDAASDAQTHAPPEDCCWIEVKSIAQTAYRDGAPAPNARYAPELKATINDLRKLATNEHILHGWLLVTLCAHDEKIARHDLHALAQHASSKGVGITDTIVETTSIADRVGNAIAAIGLFRAPVTG
ncbi:MAG: hypothetical protein AAGK04_13590 [Planctomycetota bacterium]